MSQHLPLLGKGSEAHQCFREYCGVPGLLYYLQLLSSLEQQDVLSEVDAHEWQHDLKRRIQHYGFKYDYKARRVDLSMHVGPLPPFAIAIGQKMLTLGLLREPPDQLIVNEYQAGLGIAPHIDCEPCFKDTIATISFGSVYTMHLAELFSGQSREVDLELGSCLVFSGPARMLWKNGIELARWIEAVPAGGLFRLLSAM
jgi:alkylated DNA repair dioxygenase AlkB